MNYNHNQLHHHQAAPSSPYPNAFPQHHHQSQPQAQHHHPMAQPTNPDSSSRSHPSSVAPSPTPQQHHGVGVRNGPSSNPSCSIAKLQQLTSGIERSQSIPPPPSPIAYTNNMNHGSPAHGTHHHQSGSTGNSTLTPPPARSSSNSSSATPGSPSASQLAQYQKYLMNQHHTNSVSPNPYHHPQQQIMPHQPGTAQVSSRSSVNSSGASATSSSNHHGHHESGNTSSSGSGSSSSGGSASNNNNHHHHKSSKSKKSSSSSSHGSSSTNSLIPPNAGNAMTPNMGLMPYGQYPQFAAAQYFSGAQFLNQHSHAAAMQMIHGHHGAGAGASGQNQYHHQDPRAAGTHMYNPYAYPPGLMSQLNQSMRR